jgi:NarL family two-component system response regulator LiaR
MQEISVLLADDHTILRESLREVIDRQSDMRVVGEAADGVEAVSQAQELAPDIILMDIRMPELDGVEATRLINAQDEEVGIIILTMYRDDAHVFEAIRAGAMGYILKDAEMEELLAAIRGVHRGEAMIDAAMAGRMLVDFLRPGGERERGDHLDLTAREAEILGLVAKGASNQEIAAALFLSEHTARNALSIVFKKLHVNNRTEAVVRALRKGWLKLE